MSSFPNLHSLRVSNSGIQLSTCTSPAPTRFPVLQELTLNGYHFDAENMIDVVWPEICQLKSLRLEKCTFGDDDLAQILRRKTPRLRSLALFSMRHPFSDIAPCLENSLEELWLENCWPRWLESNLTAYAYSSLRSLHLEWDLFVTSAPFFPANLRRISIAVPRRIACGTINYDRFEARLERLSLDLPKLQEIRVLGHRRYSILNHETELREKLSLQGIRLVIQLIYRGDGENLLASLLTRLLTCILHSSDYPSWTWKEPPRPDNTGWHEWLYI